MCFHHVPGKAQSKRDMAKDNLFYSRADTLFLGYKRNSNVRSGIEVDVD